MRELAERGDRAGADRLQPAMTLLWTIARCGMAETLERARRAAWPVQEWRRAYEAGASCAAIAHGAGCSLETVRHQLRRQGVRMRRPGPPAPRRIALTPEMEAALRAAKAAGQSDRQAAERLGVALCVVRRWCRELGLPPAPCGRRRLLPPDAEVLRKRALGRSVADIAAAYGVSEMTVYLALKRARRAADAAAQEGAP